jgi:hypothetical protein
MKKILIAVEREKFIYLFKFNEAQISTNCVIDLDYNSLTNLPIRSISKRIESALPFFESEDEVILLEYLKEEINLMDGFRITFNGVLGIIPISEFAFNSLKSRLNPDFNIYRPLKEELTKDIKRIREDKIRINAVNKILSLLNLQIDNSFLISLRGIVIKMISNETFDGSEKKALMQLIKFDLTPSFIPSGNVESLLKLGCITLLTLGAPIDALKNGPYFSIINENFKQLNQKSLYQSYLELERLTEFANSEDKIRIKKVKETLNSEFSSFNAFLSYYIYLSFNRIIKDEDFDLTKINGDILDLKNNCPNELAYALSIFGYVHSFDRLYESIHRLSSAPIFDIQTSFKREPLLEETSSIDRNYKEDEEPFKSSHQDKLDKLKTIPKTLNKAGSNQEINNAEVKGDTTEIEKVVETKVYLETIDKTEINKISEPELDKNKVEDKLPSTGNAYKELDFQSIFTAISKIRFNKQEKRELKEKFVKDFYSIIQKESASGIESFGFDTIKTFILKIVKVNPALKQVSEEIIKKLEDLF